jgi:sarcosine oxidase, subunit beta
MKREAADVVICGAGIAGISSAYHLSRLDPKKALLLVDDRPPLSLTSDKSTECYRNWWPGPDDAKVRLMDHSIGWLDAWADQTGNAFGLNRRGYLYASTTDEGAARLLVEAQAISALGAGEVRVRPGDYHAGEPAGSTDHALGADYLTDPSTILHQHPYLSPHTKAVLHVRKAGWFRARDLGMWLLGQARGTGVELRQARVIDVEHKSGVFDVVLESDAGRSTVRTPSFVNAAGPFLNRVHQWIGADLPIAWELHWKAAFADDLGVIPRSAPLVILSDTQRLEWTDEEAALLAETLDGQRLLAELPGGAHIRPEGGAESPYCLALWAYDTPPVLPKLPITPDPAYCEVALRGLRGLIPGLSGYLGRLPAARVDGGYYTRTPDNRPLVGPGEVKGYYLMGALSGFGVMAAPAAGELLARSVLGLELPGFAQAFIPQRFDDRAHLERLSAAGRSGEL